MRHCLATVLLFTMLACSPPDQAPGDGLVAIVDSTGSVPVVTVTGEAPQWRLESLAVIRPEPEVGFSNIRSLALDPRGGVWVADVGEERLSRWGDDGGWIEDKGRVGSGPGEFRSPYSVAVHDGGLQVLDVQNSRIVRFGLAGGADSSWLIPARVTGGATDVRLFPDPRGPRYMNFVREPTPRVAFVRTTDSTDIVFQPDNDGREAGNVKVCQLQGAIHFFGSPFAPASVRTPWAEATVATSQGEYQIDRFGRDAALVSSVRRPVIRDSVSDAEFDSEIADWLKFSAEHPGVACTGEIIRYRLKPAIRRLLPSDDGHLWVEQQLPGGGFRFEVWAADSLLGVVPSPSRIDELPPAIRSDRLAVVAESPDGGHEVRLYRVVRREP
jgi:hypothetical protein